MIEIKNSTPLLRQHQQLDLENIFTIADLFRQNISVMEWEKWNGNVQTNFVPFQKIPRSRSFWMAENLSDASHKVAEGCNYVDVLWMPEYVLSHLYDGGKVDPDRTFAYMEYDSDTYATKWSLCLVSIDLKQHRLFIWDECEKIWAEFRFAQDPVNNGFIRLLHAWIDW